MAGWIISLSGCRGGGWGGWREGTERGGGAVTEPGDVRVDSPVAPVLETLTLPECSVPRALITCFSKFILFESVHQII